jgi:hypothetical protein
MHEKYDVTHFECLNYLNITYLRDYKRRFVRYFINQFLHFGITITFRGEKEHAALKRQLRESIENLKSVMNEINLLLINEHQNYLIAFDEIKMKFPRDLRRSVFHQLAAYVTSYALRKIFDQYQLLIERLTVISRCINVFTTTTRLFCSHKIQKRLYEIEECLKLKNVHTH